MRGEHFIFLRQVSIGDRLFLVPIKMLLLILTLLPLVSGRCAPYWGSLKCASCVTRKHGWGRKPCGWNTATSQCEKANAESSASLQTTVDMCAATTTSTSSPALLSDNGATTTPLLRRGRGSSLDFTDQPYAGASHFRSLAELNEWTAWALPKLMDELLQTKEIPASSGKVCSTVVWDDSKSYVDGNPKPVPSTSSNREKDTGVGIEGTFFSGNLNLLGQQFVWLHEIGHTSTAYLMSTRALQKVSMGIHGIDPCGIDGYSVAEFETNRDAVTGEITFPRCNQIPRDLTGLPIFGNWADEFISDVFAAIFIRSTRGKDWNLKKAIQDLKSAGQGPNIEENIFTKKWSGAHPPAVMRIKITVEAWEAMSLLESQGKPASLASVLEIIEVLINKYKDELNGDFPNFQSRVENWGLNEKDPVRKFSTTNPGGTRGTIWVNTQNGKCTGRFHDLAQPDRIRYSAGSETQEGKNAVKFKKTLDGIRATMEEEILSKDKNENGVVDDDNIGMNNLMLHTLYKLSGIKKKTVGQYKYETTHRDDVLEKLKNRKKTFDALKVKLKEKGIELVKIAETNKETDYKEVRETLDETDDNAEQTEIKLLALVKKKRGGVAGVSNVNVPDATPSEKQQYASQLEKLMIFGLSDVNKNVQALKKAGGSVEMAANHLMDGN